jgi:hypothetical protein
VREKNRIGRRLSGGFKLTAWVERGKRNAREDREDDQIGGGTGEGTRRRKYE